MTAPAPNLRSGIVPIRNLMKDPATAPARIYVGNLDIGAVEQELQEVFQPFGKIIRIFIQRNFGFIQFDSEESAQKAINYENGFILKGKRLNVRAAITGEGGKSAKNQVLVKPPNNGSDPSATPQPPSQIQQSTPQIPQPQLENVSPDQGIANPYPRRNKGNGRRGGGGGGVGRNDFRDRSPLNRDPGFTRNDFPGNHDPYVGPTPGPVLQRRKADCNDCEIIVVAKSLTEYAEYIERRLKQCGLSVDLLFPNEDVPIGRVLANIASRGCLYAILITPQNEEHGSLTLNILYGSPQEHRNMPTEDAINLISRNFDAYMRGDKNIPGSVTMGPLAERHPEAIQVLLNLLAENRQLTVLQYDRIIKYLQERRELQLKVELGDAADDIESHPQSKQATELQNRILSILNNKTSEPANPVTPPGISQLMPSFTPKPVASAPPVSSAPLLNDPSVQKALDSLLNADLLKSIVKPASSAAPSSNDNYGTNYSANIRRF